MSYITVPDGSGTHGIFDALNPKKKKKAKKKAKAQKKKAEEELKKLDKELAKEEGDPSKRPEGIGARVSSMVTGSPSVPDWMIYAGAGVAVLGIILWSRK